MRGAWRAFLGSTGLATLFLYRDEFREDLDQRDLPLPAVLLGVASGSPPEVLVSAAELKGLAGLPALIDLVKTRLAGTSG
jgi:hypothetical protein